MEELLFHFDFGQRGRLISHQRKIRHQNKNKQSHSEQIQSNVML